MSLATQIHPDSRSLSASRAGQMHSLSEAFVRIVVPERISQHPLLFLDFSYIAPHPMEMHAHVDVKSLFCFHGTPLTSLNMPSPSPAAGTIRLLEARNASRGQAKAWPLGSPHVELHPTFFFSIFHVATLSSRGPATCRPRGINAGHPLRPGLGPTRTCSAGAWGPRATTAWLRPTSTVDLLALYTDHVCSVAGLSRPKQPIRIHRHALGTEMPEKPLPRPACLFPNHRESCCGRREEQSPRVSALHFTTYKPPTL
jgi:hypothetical protein